MKLRSTFKTKTEDGLGIVCHIITHDSEHDDIHIRRNYYHPTMPAECFQFSRMFFGKRYGVVDERLKVTTFGRYFIILNHLIGEVKRLNPPPPETIGETDL